MADTSELEKMGRELTCPICLSLLKYAVSLTCNHIFCNHCIQKSMKSDSSCPVCKLPFRPREIHPAPNIDNMVSIYKRMEAASGISIFVTQNGPDEQKKAEGGGNSGGKETGGTCKEREDNGKKTKAKQCKKSLQTNQKNSGTYPVNPSFPTKKRVQVPQYPHSGTPTHSAASKRESYEPTKDGPMDGSTVLKEKPTLNENGEVVFSPFFWLRDDEDAEKMSQRMDVDHLMDMPTPNVPSFSDIKDSDDDFASKMTPTVAAPKRSNMENLYDSEMFEWTQRACSPELRSSPTTLQVVDTDELNGNQEPDNMISPSISLRQETHATYGELLHIPFPSTKIDNDQERVKKSNKRGRKASERAQRKCTKHYIDNVLGMDVGLKEVAETQEQTCEHNETSSNLKKAAKRTKVAHCDIGAPELSPENIPTILVIPDGELPRMSSPRIKIANIQDGVTKSNKRERKASESAQRKCIKSCINKVLGNHVGLKEVAETREQICEHNETLSNFKKVAKRTKVAHCDVDATGLSPANVPSIPVVPDGELFHMSSPRTEVANNQDGLKNSNKKDGKVSERAQRKCTKSNRDKVLGMHIDSKEVVGSSELSTENVSTVPVGPKPMNQADGNAVIKHASLGIKQGRDEGFNSKKTGRSLKKIKIQNLKDCPLRSEDLRPDASKVNTLENAPLNKKQRVLMSAIDPNSAPELRKKTKACYDNQPNLKSTIDPKSAPELRKKSKACYDVQPNLKSAIDPKSAPELRKKSKAHFDDISKDDLVVSVRKCNSKVVAKDTHPIKKALGNSEFNVLNSSPTMEKSLSLMNGVALRKCVNIPNKFQCAFCHSPDNLKVSGELVHYFNGKPVASDHNGGANVIHSHRNCTEWAPNVYFEDDMAINLEAEIARSRRIKCSFCGIKGAALGCYEKSCRRSFHVPCAKSTPQCRWDTENFVILCPIHASSKLPNEIPQSQLKRRKHCNPKGQSPTQLAQVSPKHTPNWHWNSRGSSDKIVLCCSALTIEEKEIMSEFEKLTGVTELKKWSSSVTHVIASTDENGTCRRTLKFLMGILEGKWILSIEWIKACMKDMKHVNEESYEIGVDIHGIKNGPRLGRLRLINKEPKLFEGFKFYFTGDFIPSYKGYLQDLIIAAGGSVLHRKPIPQDQEALFSGSSTALTFIIYCVELPDKSDSNTKDLVFKQRRLDAESLARTSGAKVVSNTRVLNSIAGHRLENDGEW